jgi:hypothetical protein
MNKLPAMAGIESIFYNCDFSLSILVILSFCNVFPELLRGKSKIDRTTNHETNWLYTRCWRVGNFNLPVQLPSQKANPDNPVHINLQPAPNSIYTGNDRHPDILLQ